MKICFVAEGSYPYVMGGVSSWVHSMIRLFPQVDFSVINGKKVVEDGRLLTVDLEELIRKHNEIAVRMVGKYPEPERFKLV